MLAKPTLGLLSEGLEGRMKGPDFKRLHQKIDKGGHVVGMVLVCGA